MSGSLWAQEPSEEQAEKQSKPTPEFTLTLGESSGAGARYWFKPNMAIDMRSEFSLFPVAAVMFNASYHLSFAEVARKDKAPIAVYVGAGLKVGAALNEASLIFGGAAPIGASLPLKEGRLRAFVELAPGVVFLQGVAILDLDALLGIRFALPTGE
jgi:hypothetical protein